MMSGRRSPEHEPAQGTHDHRSGDRQPQEGLPPAEVRQPAGNQQRENDAADVGARGRYADGDPAARVEPASHQGLGSQRAHHGHGDGEERRVDEPDLPQGLSPGNHDEPDEHQRQARQHDGSDGVSIHGTARQRADRAVDQLQDRHGEHNVATRGGEEVEPGNGEERKAVDQHPDADPLYHQGVADDYPAVMAVAQRHVSRAGRGFVWR